MKKLRKIQISMKARAIMSVVADGLIILCQFIPDDPTPLSYIGLSLSIVALGLIVFPMLCKPEIRDELFYNNFAKAAEKTMIIIYCLLLIVGVGIKLIGQSTITLDYHMFIIAFCTIYCIQNTILAIYESLGSSNHGEDE